MTVFPLQALRAVTLAAQGLHRRLVPQDPPGRDEIARTVDALGCVQIDTLQMVARSQYLALWSRLGTYDMTDLDALASPADRRLFEGWQHAACLVPLGEYRYQIPAHHKTRDDPSGGYFRWLQNGASQELVRQVRARIQQEGALRVSDFVSDEKRTGTWWSWRPAKIALEYLYATGELMITERRKFQRVYDLAERVLPPWVDRSEPSPQERDRFWVERGARAMGIGLPRHAGDYTWMQVTRSRPTAAELLKQGILVAIQGRLHDGSTADLVLHRETLPLLEQAADGALLAERTTFLSPFDSLFWAGKEFGADKRDVMFWGFQKLIECYVPAEKRIYGYFSLPILHRDALVGRFDPKLERKTGLLRLRSIHLEPGVKPDEELVQGVTAALRDFMNFHQARELVIERSEPASFARKLMKGYSG